MSSSPLHTDASTLRRPPLRLSWSRGRIVLGVVGTVVTLVVLVRLLDLAQIRVALDRAIDEPGILALIAVAYTAAFWLRAVAWRWLLSTPLSLGKLFSILQVSLFLNHVLPLRAGEVSRPLLAARYGVPIVEAASTTVVARVMDFAVLAIIAFVAVPSLGTSRELSTPFYAAAVLLLAACLGLAALRQGMHVPVPTRTHARLDEARASLRAMSISRLAAATPLVAASWLLESAVLLGAARLLGCRPVACRRPSARRRSRSSSRSCTSRPAASASTRRA